MKNVTTFIDEVNQTEIMIEEGFNESLVVKIDNGWDREWSWVRKTAVPGDDVKAVYGTYSTGVAVPSEDVSWVLHTSHYWLVRRSNGKMYPFPLLFASQEERLASMHHYNDCQWIRFYGGNITSVELENNMVDCPTEKEIIYLLAQIEQELEMDQSPWDDLDARGGLIPRWAA